MCVVGSPFVIDVVVRATTSFPAFVVLVNAPTFDRSNPRDCAPLRTAHVPHTEVLGSAADGDPDALLYHVKLTLAAFPRTGFYDWQVCSAVCSACTNVLVLVPRPCLSPALGAVSGWSVSV